MYYIRRLFPIYILQEMHYGINIPYDWPVIVDLNQIVAPLQAFSWQKTLNFAY